jgi:hypothetical protein
MFKNDRHYFGVNMVDKKYKKAGLQPFSLSGKRDSNPRPSAWEADALPLSYSRVFGDFFLMQIYCNFLHSYIIETILKNFPFIKMMIQISILCRTASEKFQETHDARQLTA